jgi:hypothetical protein
MFENARVTEDDAPWIIMLDRLAPDEKRRAAAYLAALARRLDVAGTTAADAAKQAAERADRRQRYLRSGESAARDELRGRPRIEAVEAASARYGVEAEAVDLSRAQALQKLQERIRARRDREALRLARRGLENRAIVQSMKRRGYDVSTATLTRIMRKFFRAAPLPAPRRARGAPRPIKAPA